jgi:D-arabinose 1-dehydrogenase-like Zn-dependent alcohol dehydrogenase
VEGGVKRASTGGLGVELEHINAIFERMRAGKIDGRIVLTV